MITSLRIKHWIKNVVIFAAPLFALEIQISSLFLTFTGFICFSFLASAFYLVNDVLDIENDRNHPIKRKRPIASGEVSVSAAIWMATLLAITSGTVAFFLNMEFGIILCIYAFLQILYNWQLKRKVVFDIMVIAIGFVLRALSGAVIVGVPASGWFLLSAGFLALFLGIEKRKAELNSESQNMTRKVLRDYSLDWLHKMESVATSAAIVTYSLWTIESSQSNWFLLTIPLVVFVIFKYQQLSETEIAETPEVIMLKKPEILVSVFLWGAVSLLILLVEHGYLF